MWFEEEQIQFDSSNGIYKVYGKIMKPVNRPTRGIVQISHGMCEYIDKYDDFAKFLMKEGFIVAGHDHIGHGNSINQKDDLGFFGSKDGYKSMIQDLYSMNKIIREKYLNEPIYLLGHSMGSLIARCYAAKYGSELSGLILCGTVGPQHFIKAGIKFADLLIEQKGERYRSKMLYDISLNFASIKFLPVKTRFDWINSDQKEIERHVKDERANFIFTLKGFSDLFHLVNLANSEMLIKTVPKDLRIIFISGKDDPIGENGNGVLKAFELYKEHKIKDLDIKIYENMRHELLKEKNKEAVFKDILNWMIKTS